MKFLVPLLLATLLFAFAGCSTCECETCCEGQGCSPIVRMDRQECKDQNDLDAERNPEVDPTCEHHCVN